MNDGTTLTGEVEVKADGTYVLKTAEGDIFVFQPHEVQRLVVRNSEGSATPNVYVNNDIVYLNKGKICYIDSGAPLQEIDFKTFQIWEQYQKTTRRWETGNVLLISGGSALVLGGASMGIGLLSDEWAMEGIGLIVSSVGLIVGVVGLSMELTAKNKLKKMTKTYNESPGYVLDFGVQQHGIGLALRF